MDQPAHDLRPFQPGRAPGHRIISFGLVAALHLVFIYALATGLAQNLIMKLPQEFKAEVIPPKQEQVKPPPPPPPELQKPPPPFVPPPEISIQSEASPNTITVQSKVSTPTPPPVVAAPPKPAGITAPVQIAGGGAVCNSNYYPPIAIRLNQAGTTLVTVHIGTDGTVQSVDIAGSSGHDALDQASIKCITSRWRYKPAMQNGQPVPVSKEYAIKWVLQ
ncbi:MAG TPA: TonB family protein [Rhizomicrobium sp.]|jgi:protein TonB